jgi:hypothetical protein
MKGEEEEETDRSVGAADSIQQQPTKKQKSEIITGNYTTQSSSLSPEKVHFFVVLFLVPYSGRSGVAIWPDQLVNLLIGSFL